MDRGRFTECETLLRQAAGAPGSHVAEARWGLVLLLRMEGRFEEAHRWLEDGFDVMTSPVETLQRLYRLDVDPFPIDGVRTALERAGRQAPADDRVWLARAHLAILRGEFADAELWLERCPSSRPDDSVVWRMKLECGLAAGRLDQVRQALRHLPAALESKQRVAALRAWLAEREGDHRRERLALQQAIELNPADAPALERLAELEHAEGRADFAARHRERIRAIDRDRKQYIRLLASSSPETHAAELASSPCGSAVASTPTAGRNSPRRLTGMPGQRRRVEAIPLSEATREGVTLADLIESANAAGRSHFEIASALNLVVGEFTDDASTARLDFVHENGGATGKLIPPVTASGGVGLIDFDNDGWLDVYLVQGGSFPPDENSNPSASGDRLYRNRGDGSFEDVTVRSGIRALAHGYGHGIAVGDIDNDGWPDLFVTRWRRYALYRNRGDGTFEDITENAGLAGDRDWPTSAALADLDGDGDLDLYVCHYFKWNENETRSCVDPEDRGKYRCLPLDFEALPDHVFRNDGGRFIDVTGEAGIVDTDGRGLGVLAADLDGDGRTDLFVANDMTANYLFRNLGGFRFEEIALTAGVAGNASGTYQAGMGVACGDLDRDGRLDLAVTNFYNESTTFFQNLGQGFFADRTAAVGLAVPSRYCLGFGISFLDANNDGWLDLITANGHVHDGRPQFPWKMPVQLFMGTGDGRLVDASTRSGAAISGASHGAGPRVRRPRQRRPGRRCSSFRKTNRWPSFTTGRAPNGAISSRFFSKGRNRIVMASVRRCR